MSNHINQRDQTEAEAEFATMDKFTELDQQKTHYEELLRRKEVLTQMIQSAKG